MKKQTMNNWIKNKLIENNQDIEKVKALFDLCKEELHTKGSKQNYYRRIRETIQEMKKEGTKFTSPIDYSNWNREELIELLTQEILRLEKKLSIEDIKKLSEKNRIPYGAFIYYLPDIKDVIKQVYSHNLIQLKDDIDSQKLKEKIKLLTKENNHLKSLQVDYSSLVDVLEDVVTIYEPFDKPVYIQYSKKKREGLALISDTHFGEVIDLEEMHGINEYNPEIAKRRLDQYFRYIIDWSKEVSVDILNISLLGDVISGRIHEELLEHNALNTTDTVLQLADYLSQWFKELKFHFKSIKVNAVSGNHGRMTKQVNFKGKQKINFDYFVYEFLKRSTINIVDEFVLPESFFIVDKILGHSFCFLHGDVFRGGTGLSNISPTWGRDIAKLNGLLKHSGLSFEFIVFGHFHTGATEFNGFDGTKIITNGSLKGSDSYSIAVVKSGQKASQQFLVIEEDTGVLFNNAIYLD